MPRDEDDIALARFLCGRTDNADFHHKDHLRVAFALLRNEAFADAAQIFARCLRRIAERAGRPEAYHETITVAFLSLVAERMAARAFVGFDEFAEANADLLDKTVLSRWYSRERLHSNIARQVFVLP